ARTATPCLSSGRKSWKLTGLPPDWTAETPPSSAAGLPGNGPAPKGRQDSYNTGSPRGFSKSQGVFSSLLEPLTFPNRFSSTSIAPPNLPQTPWDLLKPRG